MQKKIILRLGLVGVVAAASSASAFAAGCSSSSSAPETPVDSGADGTGFPDASGDSPSGQDSGADTGDSAAPVHAKISFVHAAPGLPAFRFCYGAGSPPSIIGGLYPLPNNPASQGPFPFLGVWPGTGGTLPDLTDLQNLEVTLYVVIAQDIAGNTSANANELDCSHLIGTDGDGGAPDAGGLVLNQGYFALPAIPANTFLHGKSYLAAIEGCLPNAPLNTAVCGSTWNNTTGNIALHIYEVDNSTPAATTMGVQVLHASSAWDGVTSAELQGQPVANTFGIADLAIDGGGGNAPVATLINFGAGPTPDAAAPQTVVPTDYANLSAYITESAPDGGPLVVGLNPEGGAPEYAVITKGLTFPDIQALSGYATAPDGGVAGPLYLPGSNFVLVWLGDPSQPEYIGADGGALSVDAGGQFNTAFPHFLMFPSDPTPPPLTSL